MTVFSVTFNDLLFNNIHTNFNLMLKKQSTVVNAQLLFKFIWIFCFHPNSKFTAVSFCI